VPRPGSKNQRGYDVAYQHARAALLANHPACYWCARRGKTVPATTADHVPSIKEVGHPHLNLVPACGPCNFGRSNSKAPPPPSRVW
jgi:5-methylcytosine-specific restriction endonuclease McrA